MIPRLPPSADPFIMNMTINVRLRPYFEKWYEDKKLDGEDPQQFLLRKLKDAAMDDYGIFTLSTELSNINKTRDDSIDDLRKDVDILSTEVD